MGGMVMGKCKDKQRKSCIAQIDCKHFQGIYGRLQLGDVYTCQQFSSKNMWNLKKLIPEHFFTSLLYDLSIKDLVTLGKLLLT